jgi:hypothetical protein
MQAPMIPTGTIGLANAHRRRYRCATMRNENLLMERFWARHAKLGVMEMSRQAGVRAQHVADVVGGRRPPNSKLAAWLGFEIGWLPKPRIKPDATTPVATATDSAPAQTPQPEA